MAKRRKPSETPVTQRDPIDVMISDAVANSPRVLSMRKGYVLVNSPTCAWSSTTRADLQLGRVAGSGPTTRDRHRGFGVCTTAM